MTADHFARAREIFLNALNHPEKNRVRYVEEQCAGDASLQREVNDLLAAHLPTVMDAADHRPGETTPKIEPPGSATPVVRSGTTSKLEAPASRDFAPGTLIAERYQIVSRLGAGGMGEVFRADDVTLEQPVALKFLPPAFVKSPAWIARFRQEARLARTVTHPAVCRVHDLAEWNGEYFLTMEYVDGEDLASLYRRIGRLPVERALDVAKQLCLGLAVAHHKDVLHRDLKPANIMIDGSGQVRITDFGVAALAHEIPDSDVRTGTAAHMSPEQITGRGVSIKSDLYSLGLVLFELFTGRPAFQAETTAEYAELHVNATPPSPSQFARDIPPEVERIILQCLAKDPADRPASAMLVAAALPGSNVLSAMVAANLTPPPDAVAMAQTATPHTNKFVNLALIALFIAGAWTFRSMLATGWDHLGATPPGALRERARVMLEQLGSGDSYPHSAYGYAYRHEAETLLSKYAPTGINLFSTDAESGAPVFWYRASAVPMVAEGAANLLFGNGRVTPTDPWPRPGSTTIVFDSDGFLIGFISLPTLETENPKTQESSPSFQPLLRAAGMNAVDEPRILLGNEQSAHATSISTWQSSSDRLQEPMKAIGVAAGNQPIFFAVASDQPMTSAHSLELGFFERKEIVSGGMLALFLFVIAVALPWAWRGYWSGRIDRDGAVRLALVVFLFSFLPSLLLIGHGASVSDEVNRLSMAILRALGTAGAVAVLFVVVDLNTRRYWPEILVTWNRVIRSQFRDGAVRRHVLSGVFVGCLWAFLGASERLLVQRLGRTVDPYLFGDHVAEKLYGLRDALASYLLAIPKSIADGLLLLLLLILIRIVTRNAKLAIAITVLLLIPAILPRGAHPLTSWLFLGVGGIGVFLVLLTRVGLLAAVVAFFVTSVLTTTPLAGSLQAWYVDLSFLGLGLVALLAGYGSMSKSPQAFRA